MKNFRMNNGAGWAWILGSRAMLAGACLSLGGITAMATSKNGLNTFDFGNNYAGAKGSYGITAQNSSGDSQTTINADATVKFLNRSVKGVCFTATVDNASGRKSTSYRLQVAGYTVDSGTKSISYTWNKGINQTLVSASIPIAVGPVPVTISGSVGGGASIGYTLQLNPSGVGLSGQAAAWMNGSASAGVGVPILNVALRADLTLGKTSLNPSVTVTPTTMSGQANLVFDPVRIDFAAVLESCNKVWYQVNLASYAAPSKTVTLLKL